MFSTLLQGLLLGYGAAIPLGPINILIANYALHSYKKAFIMGLGAMSADITYLLFITFGVLKLLEGSFFLTFITFLGAIFLFYIAFLTYQQRNNTMKKQSLKHEHVLEIFIKGYTLTLLNPYTVGFWLSISTLQANLQTSPLWLILGLIFSITSWITLMPWMIYKSKHLFSAKIITLISLFSAVILAGFGLWLLLQAIRSLS